LLRGRPAGTVGGRDRRRRHANAERPDAGDDVGVGRHYNPAHGVRTELERPHGGDDVGSFDPCRPGEVLADAVEYAHCTGEQRHALVEAEPDRRGAVLELGAEARRGRAQRRVRGSDGGERERDEEGDDEGSHRCGSPASGERCPNTGATSRSAKSWIETATTINAKPARSTTERGRQTSSRGNTAIAMNVHPSVWCRNAERAKNHEFCSWTMNATPLTTNASGHVSRQYGDSSR